MLYVGVGARVEAWTVRGGFPSSSGRVRRGSCGVPLTCPKVEKRVRKSRIRDPPCRVRSTEDESFTYTFGTDESLNPQRSPPPNFMCFDVVKTLVVPVSEPRPVSRLSGSSNKSLEQWISSPENVMGVVFEEGGVEEIKENLWRILVLRLQFMDWELCPEFDLQVLGGAKTKNSKAVRMRSEALRLVSNDENSTKKKAPPGFGNMDVWSDIECELFVKRGTGGLEDNAAVKNTTAVCADLKITIAADVPWALRLIPYFQNAGEGAISGSIDGVGKSARARVQAAYELWTKDGDESSNTRNTEKIKGTEGVKVE